MITAVLMPTTSPCDDTSGPPELPGLSAASVWITSSISRPLRERSERPSAETTPVVTVDSKPSGLPMAITSWPRLSRLESPSGAAGSVTASIDAEQRQIGVGIVADQPRAQVLAVGGGHVDARGSAGGAAAPATWLLVRMSPSGATTTPEPVPPRGFAVAAGGLPARMASADHGRADAVDHVDDGARIGVEQRLVFGRNLRMLARRGDRGGPRRASLRGMIFMESSGC